MSLQPIDLQNLLLRLDQISKEQTAQREAIRQQQTVAGREIALHSEEEERHVGKTRIVEEGPNHVHEDGGSSGRQERRRPERERLDERGAEEVVSDPNIGQHIDVSG